MKEISARQQSDISPQRVSSIYLGIRVLPRLHAPTRPLRMRSDTFSRRGSPLPSRCSMACPCRLDRRDHGAVIVEVGLERRVDVILDVFDALRP